MSALAYRDPRADPQRWARDLGISDDAVGLYLASDVIDLHVDSFIWQRIFRYDLRRRHGHGITRAHFLSQVDLPRVREAGLTGATWVITTNPLRTAGSRPAVLLKNLARLRAIFESVSDDVALVRNAGEYRAARSAGKHAAFIGVQGGNALDRDAQALDLIPDDAILRVTLVHLSNSRIGVSSAPTSRGRERGYQELCQFRSLFPCRCVGIGRA